MSQEPQSSPETKRCSACGRHQLLQDAAQVAEALRVHPETIRKMARLGEIAYIKVGRRTLFAPSDIALYIEAQTVTRRPSAKEIRDSLPSSPTRASMLEQRVAAVERIRLPAVRREA